QAAEDRLAGQRRRSEGFEGGRAVTPRLEQPGGPEEDERLVEVEQRGPHRVAFLDEEDARLRAQLEGAEDLALLAVGDGEIGQGFRGLVPDLQAAELGEALFR